MPEPEVSVLIPARDEEANLAACLDSILPQPCLAEVLIYDDHSSDTTGEIAASYAARDPRVRLARRAPLPPGWCGKNFACSQLAAQAGSGWLLFLDADARLAPGALPRMLVEARARSATFLSCWPGIAMVGFWEKLLMPMLNFVVFTCYPAPLGLIRRDPSLSLAHGACILVARSAYEAVGGHTVVAHEIFEDTLLAREWRRRGETAVCVDGQDVVSVRMYESAEGIWLGFQKNLRSAFRTSAGFWCFLVGHAVFFLGPFVTGNELAMLLVVAIRLLLAWRFRQPLWSALLHPFAEVFFLALGLSSWWKWRRSRGVEWKGRRYRPA